MKSKIKIEKEIENLFRLHEKYGNDEMMVEIKVLQWVLDED